MIDASIYNDLSKLCLVAVREFIVGKMVLGIIHNKEVFNYVLTKILDADNFLKD